MNHPHMPLTPRTALLLLLLLLLSFAGNYFCFTLFFGADFIFGSIAVLMTLYLFGPVWGLTAALIAGVYTYFLWSQPYALVTFMLEAGFVAWGLHRGYRNILLLDGIFWLLLGMPFIWVCYGLVMQLDLTTTWLIMVKQPVNGIFNALLASLAINHLPFRKLGLSFPGLETVSFQDTLFNLLVAAILFPALLILFFISRGEMRRMETEIVSQMQRVSGDLTNSLESWLQHHLQAVVQLAQLASHYPPVPSAALQHDIELLTQAHEDFHNMYVADAQGTAIAFYPPVNMAGESTIGLNFADRLYFKELQQTRRPVLSEVFMGRGGVSQPIIAIAAPILTDDRFRGFALAAVDLSVIRKLLEPLVKDRRLQITLIDAQNRVITGSQADRPPLTVLAPAEVKDLRPVGLGVYHRLPGEEVRPAMRRWQQSFYVLQTPLGKDLPWKLVLEVPLAPHQKYLYTIYIRNMSLMAALAVAVLLLAVFFSRWIVRPLSQLAQVTANLPDRLAAAQTIEWPQSSAVEIHSLIDNFQVMAGTLEGNLLALKERRETLEKTVGDLQAEVTERLRAEEAMRQSETKYRVLVEQIPAVTYIGAPDQTSSSLFVSPQVEILTGYPPADWLADPELWFKTIHPDDQERVRAEYEQSQAQGRPFRAEYRLLSRDQQVKWVTDEAHPVRDEQGRILFSQGLVIDITERKQAEETLKQVNEKLHLMVQEAEERRRWATLLNEMGDFLQSCQTSEEAFQDIGRFGAKFFPEDAGVLYAPSESGRLLETVAGWGGTLPSESVISPKDCWAIRMGRLHVVSDPQSGLICPHVTDPAAPGYLCAPVLGQGVSMLLLHLRSGDGQPLTEPKQQLAVSVAEHLGLSLANLKLQETMRRQAIRDPLTGLYNRRYLEETLPRELHRARRTGAPVGVIMMDLDHFKRLNDTFGHPAGDLLLDHLGRLLLDQVREEDIACRYGGEEFLLILPGASLTVSRERAEKLRQAVKQLQVEYRGKLLDPLTLSLGVAVFPEHGADGETLIRRADDALYRAKQEGRDRVAEA